MENLRRKRVSVIYLKVLSSLSALLSTLQRLVQSELEKRQGNNS